MSLASRLASLRQRHAQVDAQLTQEANHPGTSDLQLTELKRRKLWLKDQINLTQLSDMSAMA